LVASSRRRRAARVAAALALLGAPPACSGGSSSRHAAGNEPVLSLSLNPRMVPPPTQADFDAAADLARSNGVRGVALTWTWSKLEPVAQQIDVSDVQNSIPYFLGKGFRIYVGIQPINTVKREVPPDLDGVAWDDPVMIDRFHALVDALAPVVAGSIEYLSIGNEVDVELAATGEWAAYKTFYEDAIAYLHSVLPGVPIGVTSTFGGLAGASGADIVDLNTNSDVFILTYYPLQGDFQVLPADSPATDFPVMLQAAAGRPLLLQEVGYPSGAANGSSESQQADFVTSALAQWHAAGKDLPFLSIFLMHDLDPATCDALAQYYGLDGDAAFVSFLCTLGLRHDDGAPKPAWDALVAGAN